VTDIDAAEARRAIEHYYEQGWTDGLPVVPVTESYLADFLATTDRDPDEVLIPMPHLNKNLTVRLAAINAALAGCLPEYFGPVRQRIGLNSRGNVWGSGFRANATIGRAIRLGAINGLGLKPQVFDQATQGTPAKYSCCIAENEEDSPWPSLAADTGIGPDDSAVTATVIRSVLHIEARHTTVPEQLAAEFADSLCRTGALVRPRASGYVVLNPEHARIFDKHGWSKADVKAAIAEQGWRSYRDLARTGKEAVAGGTGWRLPANHPDAAPQETPDDPHTPVQLIGSPDAVHIVVAGAPNAGVSSIVETFGPFDRAPAIAKVEEK
jgi:hypothetical protein